MYMYLRVRVCTCMVHVHVHVHVYMYMYVFMRDTKTQKLTLALNSMYARHFNYHNGTCTCSSLQWQSESLYGSGSIWLIIKASVNLVATCTFVSVFLATQEFSSIYSVCIYMYMYESIILAYLDSVYKGTCMY